jgi:hypothetical protein
MKQFAEGTKYPSRRHVYLLTCWQERDALAGTHTWRFRIETPGSDQKRVFAMLEDAMAWVESELQKDTLG